MTSTCEEEKYAKVTKMSGGAICRAILLEKPEEEVICHIRGKFRGRGKRDNFIKPGTWLLVGMRTWGSSSNEYDVMEVYDDLAQMRLVNTVTSVVWTPFLDRGTIAEEDDIRFADETLLEYEALVSTTATATSTLLAEAPIDIDDI